MQMYTPRAWSPVGRRDSSIRHRRAVVWPCFAWISRGSLATRPTRGRLRDRTPAPPPALVAPSVSSEATDDGGGGAVGRRNPRSAPVAHRGRRGIPFHSGNKLRVERTIINSQRTPRTPPGPRHTARRFSPRQTLTLCCPGRSASSATGMSSRATPRRPRRANPASPR